MIKNPTRAAYGRGREGQRKEDTCNASGLRKPVHLAPAPPPSGLEVGSTLPLHDKLLPASGRHAESAELGEPCPRTKFAVVPHVGHWAPHFRGPQKRPACGPHLASP